VRRDGREVGRAEEKDDTREQGLYMEKGCDKGHKISDNALPSKLFSFPCWDSGVGR
jgi:hypothetical protein